MKNASKKFMTLVMAIALTLGMTVQAFSAATIGPENGGKAVSSDTTLNIVKTLKVKNPALVQVAGPGLQLSYTLGPATVAEGTIITDENNNTAAVHSGPEGGLILSSSPSFSVSELLNSSASGADNTKNIVLTVDLNQFTAAGIYRYVLEDTTPAATLTAAGVVRSADFDPIRYVDVYIQTDEGQLVIEGYIVGSDADENGVLAKETFDYSSESEADTSPADTKDVFETYNVQLKKVVSGSMGDTSNEFPFAIAVSDSSRSYYAAKNVAPGPSSTNNQTAPATSLSTELKHEDIFYIAGLTNYDTVAYTETNNTDDTYSVTITGGTPSAASNVAPGSYKVMTATPAPNAASVQFENNHGSVSPTGVIMRFGPYIGMVLIAALLIVMRKRAKTR